MAEITVKQLKSYLYLLDVTGGRGCVYIFGYYAGATGARPKVREWVTNLKPKWVSLD